MPVEKFNVIITQAGSQTENKAVANASKYLAYADQTDTFGYSGDIIDINVYGGDYPIGNGSVQDFKIEICFAATIINDNDLKKFMDEMVTLSKVESVERVSK